MGSSLGKETIVIAHASISPSEEFAAATEDNADTTAVDAAPPTDTDGPRPVRLMADADTALSTLRNSLETLRDAGVEEVRLVTRSKNTP